MMRIRFLVSSAFAAAGVAFLFPATGCSRREAAPPAAATAPAPHHEHTPPHGGTAVVLGHEAAHLELVRDAGAGRLTAYVLDGELDNFIRLKAPGFEVIATVEGESRTLAFHAVANTATGETFGDTAQFEAQADWLKSTAAFSGVLTRLEVRGAVFENVRFHFPGGNEHE